MNDAQIDTGHSGITHLPATRLFWSQANGDWLREGEALLSTWLEPKTCIVFVHGYGGQAAGTWEDFQGALRTMPEAAGSDVLYYGYPSRRSSVAYCARKLGLFLGDVIHQPAKTIVNRTRPPGMPERPENFLYRRLVLCGHSMGGALIRRAMLDVEEAQGLGDPKTDVRLLLFAPAHMGSRIPGIIAAGFGLDWLPGATTVGMSLRILSPSLGDLEPGSDFLRRLSSDSCALRLKAEAFTVIDGVTGTNVMARVARSRHWPDTPDAPQPRTVNGDRFRAVVIHAERDGVVLQDSFDDDPPMLPVDGHGHSSVCKPTMDGYRLPIEALATELAW